jgi:hypothetical protein
MNKFIAVSLMLLVSSVAFAKDDCPSAADAAEAQNPNLYKDCDYSNTGLTLALKKAFGANKESVDVADKPEVKESLLVDAKMAQVSAEFSTATQLNSLRFTLIAKLAQECPKGFVVDAEKYQPVSVKTLKLELQYHCL